MNTPYSVEAFEFTIIAMQSGESFNPRPWRILLADDDSHLCHVQAEVLRQHCYEVNTVNDGQDGWEELITKHYHLLIAENNLPGLSGIGFIKKLRSAGMPMPVIVVTGPLPDWRSPQYSWLLQATKLFKPYEINELLDLVKKVLDEAANAGRPLRRRPGSKIRRGQIVFGHDDSPLRESAMDTAATTTANGRDEIIFDDH